MPAHWAGRTVIHSVAAMTYQQAHNLLEGLSPDSDSGSGSGCSGDGTGDVGVRAAETACARVPAGQAGQAVPPELWSGLRSDLGLLTVLGAVYPPLFATPSLTLTLTHTHTHTHTHRSLRSRPQSIQRVPRRS